MPTNSFTDLSLNKPATLSSVNKITVIISLGDTDFSVQCTADFLSIILIKIDVQFVKTFGSFDKVQNGLVFPTVLVRVISLEGLGGMVN